MIPAFQSALSGLRAFSTRIESNGNNIANAQTNGFNKTRVLLEEAKPHGVKTQIEKVDAQKTTVFQETGNGQEPVELSNVELSSEIPETIVNSRMYEANLKTIKAADDMVGSLLKIKS
ncbi:flagellar basal body rod C-terminal domain-containing protein [Desulfomarina sp.]